MTKFMQQFGTEAKAYRALYKRWPVAFAAPAAKNAGARASAVAGRCTTVPVLSAPDHAAERHDLQSDQGEQAVLSDRGGDRYGP